MARLEKALLKRMGTHVLVGDSRSADLDAILVDVQDFFKNGVAALSVNQLPPMSVRAKVVGSDVMLSIILHTNMEDQEVGIPELVATVYGMALQ